MIVITGAAGFIGANLAHRLAEEGHDLLLVDYPLNAAKAANLAGLSQFRFMTHNLFLEWLPGQTEIQAIFHLGACSSTTETNWDFLRKNNLEYTQTLWNWCAKHGRPFIYASSAATYGDGAQGFDDRTHPSKLKPLNLYGKSKNDFDLWVHEQLAACLPTPQNWAGLKFFNVYGPRESHKGDMASVVWKSYCAIKKTGEARLFKSNDPAYPDGGQLRDFVYVQDCVEQMIWLWRHPEVSGIFNSGTGRARTFLDLTRAVFAALGLKPNIHFFDMPENIKKQYQNFTAADMSKLRAAGYDRPPTPLENGVQEYVRWCEGNGQ